MRCTYNMPFSSKLLTLQGNGKHSDASFVMLYHIPDLEPNRRQKICPVAKGLKTIKMSLHGIIDNRCISLFLLSTFDTSHLYCKPTFCSVTRDEPLLQNVSHCTGQPLYFRINMDISKRQVLPLYTFFIHLMRALNSDIC